MPALSDLAWYPVLTSASIPYTQLKPEKNLFKKKLRRAQDLWIKSRGQKYSRVKWPVPLPLRGHCRDLCHTAFRQLAQRIKYLLPETVLLKRKPSPYKHPDLRPKIKEGPFKTSKESGVPSITRGKYKLCGSAQERTSGARVCFPFVAFPHLPWACFSPWNMIFL